MSRLAHRGPDDAGLLTFPDSKLVLGHRRLSIIDTSRAGHQPMVSRDGRWVLVFNGEIYNAKSLASKWGLTDRLQGSSDSEVLCELVAELGPERAAQSAVGMFAFGAWDNHEEILYVVRDRLGIKPLYLACAAGTIAFSSELRALRCIPGLVGDISQAGLASLLRFGYVMGPSTIYDRVEKVMPGTIVSIRANGPSSQIQRKVWWSVEGLCHQPLLDIDDREAIELVRDSIEQSVADRMITDRPLGAFLSGGVDSSLVVSMMARQSSIPIQTFSIGFDDKAYDEAVGAKSVAQHLGTDHTEFYVGEQDALDVVPQLGHMFDEPFADSSQIPTAILCSITRNSVVVSLSGDGGDELFGGYDRYAWTMRLWNRLSRVPYSVRCLAATTLNSLPNVVLQRIGSAANACAPRRFRVRQPADKAALLAKLLPARTANELYGALVGHWKDPELLLAQTLAPEDHPAFPVVEVEDPWLRMMGTDLLSYLPDDILVKVDRTSMAVGLEARVPLLDHRVAELALRLPHRMRVRHGETKWVLKQVLSELVPRPLWDRPKSGFGAPVGSWIRGPLRDWVEELLSQERLDEGGHFNANIVRSALSSHLSGRMEMGNYLWDIIMFQSWLEAVSADNVTHCDGVATVG